MLTQNRAEKTEVPLAQASGNGQEMNGVAKRYVTSRRHW